jgi:hypothetical protein
VLSEDELSASLKKKNIFQIPNDKKGKVPRNETMCVILGIRAFPK